MFKKTWAFWSLQNRRRWEQRVASVLSEKKEAEADSASRRFERIYKERQFTPVEEVFPFLRQNSVDLLERKKKMVDEPKNPRVLRVTFLGPQNAGKTSLVNALALSHVGAVSNRHGTTRDWTKAVATVHDTQLLMVDTPGIVLINSENDRRRHGTHSSKAYDSLFVCDVAVLTLPAGLGFVEPEYKHIAREVVRRAMAREMPVLLAITMMDKVQSPKHRELYFALRTDLESLRLPFAVVNETSVKGATGLVEMKDHLCRYAKPGKWQHFRREATDLSVVDIVSELLRQVYFEILPHEIPHKMSQKIIGWTRKPSATTEVVVEVFFDRPAYMFTFYAKLEAICLRAQQPHRIGTKSQVSLRLSGFYYPWWRCVIGYDKKRKKKLPSKQKT
ncbi:GTP-binding protein Era [Angomonas deanei]|nr:GTP-binding protein Era [Angomonas deanei]|eukprot:EPY43799.1 GTP-binding protein Era [Angomonas deanei]